MLLFSTKLKNEHSSTSTPQICRHLLYKRTSVQNELKIVFEARWQNYKEACVRLFKSVRLPLCMGKLGWRWKDFHKIVHLRIF